MSFFTDDFVTIHHGDCLDVMATMEPASVDAIVTDPPYGLTFMGRDWDHGVPGDHFWREALRVAKPGAHLVAFGGTRTYHRLAVAIEDAGWEIRDGLGWLYGSGFPKSLDVSKAIDKDQGENRARQLEFTAWMRSTDIDADTINAATKSNMASHYLTDKQQPAIATADMLDLMRPHLPAVPERIERLVAERTGIEWTDYMNRPKTGERTGMDMRAQRPVSIAAQGMGASQSRTFDITESYTAAAAAAAWDGWGTALKPAWEPIILARKPLGSTVAACVQKHGTGALNIDACRIPTDEQGAGREHGGAVYDGVADGYQRPNASMYTHKTDWHMQEQGRWPANIVHDGSPEVLAVFPQTSSGANPTRRGAPKFRNTYGDFEGQQECVPARGAEAGSAARFFYCAKASKSDRGEGNTHPTVKPLALMRWLVRLVTPPGGIVLDPFMGSGTTLKAARAEGHKSIGIDLDATHCEIAWGRMSQGALL